MGNPDAPGAEHRGEVQLQAVADPQLREGSGSHHPEERRQWILPPRRWQTVGVKRGSDGLRLRRLGWRSEVSAWKESRALV